MITKYSQLRDASVLHTRGLLLHALHNDFVQYERMIDFLGGYDVDVGRVTDYVAFISGYIWNTEHCGGFHKFTSRVLQCWFPESPLVRVHSG